ncbi:hypothetical protein AAVH_39475 [Aphelenchoides avenae]|nr:hypothetical protein AAVH_39475 [Aphelenchus avenae]
MAVFTDRPAGSTIQQKPLVSLVRTVQALKRASDAIEADVVAPNCADCKTFKVKVDGLEKTLETLQKEIDKLLGAKKDLLEDRQRDKVEMERLTEKMSKLRAGNAAEKPKKRNK